MIETKLEGNKLMADLTALRPWARNPRSITESGFARLKEQVQKLGQYKPLIVTLDGEVLGGNMRLKVYLDLGIKSVWVSIVEPKTEDDKLAFALSDNDRAGFYDSDLIANLIPMYPDFDWKNYSIDMDEPTNLEELIKRYEFENSGSQEARKKLADKFILPPFTILDARQEYWKDRKRAWINLGIESDKGRGENLLNMSAVAKIPTYKPAYNQESLDRIQGVERTGTSIFDPVLCEIIYKWFGFAGAKVLDPFAGGSVRGVVAQYLGLNYTGIDLNASQIKANITQAQRIKVEPKWIVGDSANVDTLAPGEYDLIFTCPPYFDLEVYGDQAGELSAMDSYEKFLEAYKLIIQKSVAMLKPDRFACFVVGDIRDKQGYYRGLVKDTISAFNATEAKHYNEAILVTSIGSLPIRVGRFFNASRKLGKAHQNVLIFYKGNTDNIRLNYKEIEIPVLEPEPEVSAGAS